MKSTITEIAARANVAKSTVSKALNGHKGVSELKRSEILALAAELEYEPSATALALSSSKTGSIGLLMPHEIDFTLSGSYWSAIITSIAQTFAVHGYSLLIVTPLKCDDLSSPIESVIRRRNVDGLIIGTEQLDPTIIARLDEKRIPFVFIGRSAQISHCFVDVDNVGGSERLVSHLVASGFRKIVCLAGPETYLYNQERVQGYRNALNAAGLGWSVIEYSSYEASSSRKAVGRILREHPDLDALFVTSGGDFLLDCIDVLKRAKGNLKAFGFGSFDDYRFFDYVDVPVCSIRQPLREIGETAANLLYSFLEDEEPLATSIVLDVELILR